MLGPDGKAGDSLVRFPQREVQGALQPQEPVNVIEGLDVQIPDLDVARVAVGEVFEFGGPQQLTMESLLREIRSTIRQSQCRVVHLPLGPLSFLLTAMERLSPRALPIAAGQLLTFVVDGTADSNPLQKARASTLMNVREMIRYSLATAND